MTFKPKLNNAPSSLVAPNAAKPKTGLAALLEQEKQQQNALAKKAEPSKIDYLPADKVQERIAICFDDSGSMSGEAIKDAQEGCIEFMRNCGLNTTAVAIFPMNKHAAELNTFTTDLPRLSVFVKDIPATGYTPMFETWERMLGIDPKATRFVIFSDGSPDNTTAKEHCIAYCIENKVPCDTVYISRSSDENEEIYEYSPARLMKEIAERTGGIYLKFQRGKANFAKAFKYLAPKYRLQLAASVDMQKAVQDGRLA